MNTPKKKYRSKKILQDEDTIEYSKEEAEWLGMDNETETDAINNFKNMIG